MTEQHSPALVDAPPLQLELFKGLFLSKEYDASNTIYMWERIPKYFFTPALTGKLRTPTGHADPYEWDFTIKNDQGESVDCKIEIQPALIKQADGSYKAFFPTKSEDNIEAALKKILSERESYGTHDGKELETWVMFSNRMLRRELEKNGCGRTYSEVKHSIAVMSKCHITIWEAGKEVYSGAILQDLITVNRQQYLDDTEKLHAARFPAFISKAINDLKYRQCNHTRNMGFRHQLTRFIYTQLVNRYIHADLMNSYHFLYSDIKKNSALLRSSATDNRKKMIEALDELKSDKVLISYDKNEKRQGKSIIDLTYTVHPHPDFIKEQKAANKRLAKARETQALAAS